MQVHSLGTAPTQNSFRRYSPRPISGRGEVRVTAVTTPIADATYLWVVPFESPDLLPTPGDVPEGIATSDFVVRPLTVDDAQIDSPDDAQIDSPDDAQIDLPDDTTGLFDALGVADGRRRAVDGPFGVEEVSLRVDDEQRGRLADCAGVGGKHRR